MCKKDEKNITKKLENEIPYRPYKCRIIWTCIVSIVALILFIVFAMNCDLTKNSNICVLIILSLLTICSFIFFGIVLFKDDQGIKFAKLNELARISEKLETELLLEDTLNMYKKDLTSMSPECQKIDINIKSKKNYELFKKYMDTLVDI